MKILKYLSIFTLIFSIFLGTFFNFEDLAKNRQPLKIENHYFLRADLHMHTRFSDGFLSPLDLVLLAKRKNLQIIGITEHNLVWPSKIAVWFSKLVDGPIVLTGQEVTSKKQHIIALGINSVIDWDQPQEKILDKIHEQGGIAIAAHPVSRYHKNFLSVSEKLDGAEVFHPVAFSLIQSSKWNWRSMIDFYTAAKIRSSKLSAIGSSDYHFFSGLGECFTWVVSTNIDERTILKAIQDGDTFVEDHLGNFHGNPKWIARFRNLKVNEDSQKMGPFLLIKALNVMSWLSLCFLLLSGLRKSVAINP